MMFLNILEDVAQAELIDTIVSYIVMIVPALSAIGAAIGTIVKLTKSFKDNSKELKNKIDEANDSNKKMADMIEEVVNMNNSLIKENADLKKKLNKVIEIETKVKQKEE